MPTEPSKVAFGRFGETAMWILVALASGPMRAARLLDEVRRLDGHVGPGALFGAVARLERRGLIEPIVTGEGRPAYRLAQPRPPTPLITREAFQP
jgi:DNA-binding PadR family transcriptional regulator